MATDELESNSEEAVAMRQVRVLESFSICISGRKGDIDIRLILM